MCGGESWQVKAPSCSVPLLQVLFAIRISGASRVNTSAALFSIAEGPDVGSLLRGGLACSLGLPAVTTVASAATLAALANARGAMDISAAVNVAAVACPSGGNSGRGAVLLAGSARCRLATSSGSRTSSPCALATSSALLVVMRVVSFNTSTCVDLAALAAIASSSPPRAPPSLPAPTRPWGQQQV